MQMRRGWVFGGAPGRRCLLAGQPQGTGGSASKNEPEGRPNRFKVGLKTRYPKQREYARVHTRLLIAPVHSARGVLKKE